MLNADKYIVKDGYIIDGETGEKAVFYICDPELNTECPKALCRALNETDIGFCATTPEEQYRKADTKAFYKVLKDGTYFGREYID